MDDDLSDLIDDVAGDEDSLDDRLLDSHLDSRLEDGAGTEEGGGPLHSIQEPTYAQPVSRATMVCLRGPCQFHWAITARISSPGKDTIRLKRVRTCKCGPQETPLDGQNIYHCTQWWPVWLKWVPEAIRDGLREKLALAYEKYLEATGYDMSWKDWPYWIFENDHKKFREHQGIGAPRPDRRTLDEKLEVDRRGEG